MLKRDGGERERDGGREREFMLKRERVGGGERTRKLYSTRIVV